MPRHKQTYIPNIGGTAKAIRTAQDECMPKTSWWVPLPGESPAETDQRLQKAIRENQGRMAASRFGTIARPTVGSVDAPSPFSAYRQGLKRSLGL
jgi:hypothetical protein